MYPHERSLVAKMQGRPVVVLGVNSDPDRGAAKAVLTRQGAAKRSWADGGPDGPIATRWHVQAWPTVYVLDARGVIRYRGNALGRQVEATVEALAREAERGRRSHGMR
jgi:hypothetical protein